MIYLKLFENFKNAGFVKYNPGTRSDNDTRFAIENAKIFDKKEIRAIKDILDGYNVSKFETHLLTNIGFWMPYKDVKSTKKYISIDKFKDEWFLLTDYPFFYECDQIDGLINCLKTLLPNKLDESLDIKNDYYYKITQDEFDNTIQNPDIYFFSDNEILILKNFVGNDFRVETEDAILITGGDSWLISDDWGLDKWIENEEIRIHNGDNIERHKLSETSKDDTIVVKNFTVRINPMLWRKSSKTIDMVDVDIMKCSDEWFLVVYGGDIMYKCDQLSGLMKFISDWNFIGEAFTDEYQSFYDINKDRDKYWDGYLKKLKKDQDELKKELEENPNYFKMISQDDAIELKKNKLYYFEANEVEEIKKLFSDKYQLSFFIIDGGIWKESKQGKFINMEKVPISLIEATRLNSCIIRIWKLEDEWYLVSTSDADDKGSVYDKCDQFDGLKRLLNQILVK